MCSHLLSSWHLWKTHSLFIVFENTIEEISLAQYTQSLAYPTKSADWLFPSWPLSLKYSPCSYQMVRNLLRPLNLNLKSSFPSSYLSVCTMFFQQFSSWHLLPFQGWAPVLKSCRWQLYISNKHCISLHLLFTFNSVYLSFPSHPCMYHII